MDKSLVASRAASREAGVDEPAELSIKILEGPGHLPIHSQIKHAIGYAIGSGQLMPGAQLPSVRDLATQLGLASNTVARAYQELQDEGLLVTRAGRGTFVSNLIEAREPPSTRFASSATLQTILSPALASAQAVGFRPDEIRSAVDEWLRAATITVGLVGLNQVVVQKWTAVVRQEYADLGVQVIPLTLDEIRSNLQGTLQTLHDVTHVFTLVTTYAGVRALLNPHGKKISALITELSFATHQELATLPPDTPIGLVCLDVYANSMLGVVSPYVGLENVRHVSPENEPELVDLMRSVDRVLYTSSSAERVQALARPGMQLIELEFVPNRVCFDQIRLLLQQEHPA